MVFDIDENLDGRRFDAGNANTTGCLGTFRNASDIATGLDYTAPPNHIAACAGAGSAGFAIDAGNASAARAITLRFAPGQFSAGKVLEFDCDTDGGLGVAGGAMRGLTVEVELTDGTILNGQLDAIDATRAQVIL